MIGLDAIVGIVRLDRPKKRAGQRAKTERGLPMARIELSTGHDGQIASQATGADVLFELGMMYCNGKEVEQDYIAAHKWFNLAALKGSDAAKEYRREISREMTAAQIAEAQREARAWLTMH